METTRKIETFVLTTIFQIAHAFLWSFVLVRLWRWFIVPLGVPGIGMAHAYGLSAVIGVFFGSMIIRMNTDPEVKGPMLAAMLILSDLVAWATGYVAHQLMQ